VAGFLGNQVTPYTQAIARRLMDSRAVAPALLRLQYTNVLRTACKCGTMNAQQAQQTISLLAGAAGHRHRATRCRPTVDPGLRHDLSSYDAAYLDVALRYQWPIATQDEALARAARITGVGVATGSPTPRNE